MCEGDGCTDCVQSGRFSVTECPYRQLDETVLEALTIADCWNRGMPPAAGGYVDQTCSIVEACRFINRDRNRWRAQQGGLDLGID